MIAPQTPNEMGTTDQLALALARRAETQRADLVRRQDLAGAMAKMKPGVIEIARGFDVPGPMVSDILVAQQIESSRDILDLAEIAIPQDKGSFEFFAQQTLAKALPVARELESPETAMAAFQAIPDDLQKAVQAMTDGQTQRHAGDSIPRAR